MTKLTEHEILNRLIFHARRQTAALRFNRFDAKLEDFLRVTTELLLGTVAHAEAVDLLLDHGQSQQLPRLNEPLGNLAPSSSS